MPGRLHRNPHTEAFGEIFGKNEWKSEESRSGTGSTLGATVEIRRRLPRLLKDFSVKKFLDAPCGDFNWMQTVSLPEGVSYIGADIVEEMVSRLSAEHADLTHRFIALDIVQGPLPEADLWLCRHTFFHLPVNDIALALRQFRESKINYLLATNHNFCRRNLDVNPGGYRFINLRKAPFNLPKPILEIDDFDILGPPNVLALWKRDQIISSRRRH